MCYGEVISEAMVKARRARRCDLCSRPINPGDRYYRQFSKEGRHDSPGATAVHARCAALLFTVQEPGECVEFERDYMKDQARETGWRAIRADARRILDGLHKRLAQRGTERK